MRQEIFHKLLSRRLEPNARTTVMLNNQAADALNWLQNEQDIQLRDIMDCLFDEMHNEIRENGACQCLQDILERLDNSGQSANDTINRKTITLSQSALNRLNQIAKDYDVPRDLLVNQMIIYSSGCISNEITRLQSCRKEGLDKLNTWKEEGIKNYDNLASRLDSSDPLMIGYREVLDNLDEKCRLLRQELGVESEQVEKSV